MQLVTRVLQKVKKWLTRKIPLFLRNAQGRANEPMARVPKRHAKRLPWHAAFKAVPVFISFALPASLYCEEYVYIYTYLAA